MKFFISVRTAVLPSAPTLVSSTVTKAANLMRFCTRSIFIVGKNPALKLILPTSLRTSMRCLFDAASRVIRNVPLPVSFHSLLSKLKVKSLQGTSWRISSVSAALRRTFSGSRIGSPSSSPPSSSSPPAEAAAAGAVEALKPPNEGTLVPELPPKLKELENEGVAVVAGAGAAENEKEPKGLDAGVVVAGEGAIGAVELPKPPNAAAGAAAEALVAGADTGLVEAPKENPAKGDAVATGATVPGTVVGADAALLLEPKDTAGVVVVAGFRLMPPKGLLLAGTAEVLAGTGGFDSPLLLASPFLEY